MQVERESARRSSSQSRIVVRNCNCTRQSVRRARINLLALRTSLPRISRKISSALVVAENPTQLVGSGYQERPVDPRSSRRPRHQVHRVSVAELRHRETRWTAPHGTDVRFFVGECRRSSSLRSYSREKQHVKAPIPAQHSSYLPDSALSRVVTERQSAAVLTSWCGDLGRRLQHQR